MVNFINCGIAGESMITMADATSKQIKDVLSGDYVAVVPTETIEVIEVCKCEVEEYYIINTSGGYEIKIASEHPILTDRGWEKVNCLKETDVLPRWNYVKNDVSVDKIVSIKCMKEKCILYSLICGDCSIICNDFLCGDANMQYRIMHSLRYGNNFITYEQYCNKLINKMVLHGKKFVDNTCFSYGLFSHSVVLENGNLTKAFIDDYQYFVFTKSIKTLESIRSLLKIGNVEDVLILLRSTFEGYLSSRYISENFSNEVMRDFMFLPIQISMNKVIYDGKEAKIRDTKEEIEYFQRNPSDLRLGKDKAYFFDFYAFLCNYAHCNFSIVHNYTNEDGTFTYEKSDNDYLVRLLVLFVYVKLFESIVTVEGEDFYPEREEKECYKLVKEVIQFLYKELEKLSKYDSPEANQELNKHMKGMFKEMRKSLKEEIGSLEKNFL